MQRREIKFQPVNPGSMLYKAPEPPSHWSDWLKIIGARLIFPPILLCDGAKFLVNKLLGEFVGRNYILPAQASSSRRVSAKLEYNIRQIKKELNNLNINQLIVETHDGAQLDTLVINNTKVASKHVDQQMYAINFLGSHTYYQESLFLLAKESIALECNTVCFNYRGVGGSSKAPKSTQDLVAFLVIVQSLDRQANLPRL